MRNSFFLVFFFGSQILALIQCFGKSEQVSLVDVNDCADIFEVMQKVDKVWAPMHFSRFADQGYEVPHRWHKNSCSVLIDMLTADDDDVFPLGLIIQTASDIVRVCVMEPGMPRLGGKTLVGPKERMLLVVSGDLKRPTMKLSIANASEHLMTPTARNSSTF